MKINIKKIMIAIAIIFSALVINPNTVDAETKANTVDNSQWLPYNYSGTAYGQMGKLKMNGIDVFCIDVATLVYAGGGYVDSTMQPADISVENQDKMAIWQYLYVNEYGSSDVAYATVQMMIWEITNPGYVTSNTIPDYASRKADILQLTSDFKIRPSFNNGTYSLKTGETITITDTNNVLSNYNLPVMGGYTFSKSGNVLTITADNTPADAQNVFVLKDVPAEYKQTNIIYKKSSSQNIGSFYNIDPPRFRMNLSKYQTTGTLEINKTDSTITTDKVNAIFNISDVADMSNIITTIETDAAGKLPVATLTVGTYYVQEASVETGYVIDQTIHEVIVTLDNTTTLDLTNQRQLGSISGLKIDSETQRGLPETELTLYLNDTGTLVTLAELEASNWDVSQFTEVTVVTTDLNGSFLFADLELGQYIIKETKAATGYANKEILYLVNLESTNNVDLTFNENLTIENDLRLISFKLFKQSSHSQMLLDGAVFEITHNDVLVSHEMTSGVYWVTTPNTPIELHEAVGYDVNSIAIQSFLTDEKGVLKEQLELEGHYVLLNKDTGETKEVIIAQGSFTMQGMKYGKTYKVCEIIAPSGYQLPAENCEDITSETSFDVNQIEHYRINELIVVETGIYNYQMMWITITASAMFILVLAGKRKRNNEIH